MKKLIDYIKELWSRYEILSYKLTILAGVIAGVVLALWIFGFICYFFKI